MDHHSKDPILVNRKGDKYEVTCSKEKIYQIMLKDTKVNNSCKANKNEHGHWYTVTSMSFIPHPCLLRGNQKEKETPKYTTQAEVKTPFTQTKLPRPGCLGKTRLFAIRMKSLGSPSPITWRWLRRIGIL